MRRLVYITLAFPLLVTAGARAADGDWYVILDGKCVANPGSPATTISRALPGEVIHTENDVVDPKTGQVLATTVVFDYPQFAGLHSTSRNYRGRGRCEAALAGMIAAEEQRKRNLERYR
jgi:hypothetical protein